MSKGLCFIISQIGSEASEERKQADALLGVIENCCELHDLECVRADRIKGSTDINDDIIEHVRSADLCVVDLTNLNPNVMYEFGIRFETGRPYIVLAHKETKLPFDTITRRTIFYDDLNLATECRRIQKVIREYIEVFEDSDFKSFGNTPSLSNIYSMLEKISNKLDGIATPTAFSFKQNSTPVDMTNLDDLLGSLDPSEAFHYAYKTNQMSLAEDLLKLLKGNHPFEYYLNKLCALASRGSAYAATELEEGLDAILESGGKESIIETIGCLVSNYARRDVEIEYLEKMDEIFSKALAKMDSNKERASILNQKQRLAAGAGKYDDAKTIAENIISMNDEEPAYFFNYATILEHLGDTDNALEQIKKAIKLADDDDDHLFLACQLLKKSKNPDDGPLYQEYLTKLETINPYKARLARFQ